MLNDEDAAAVVDEGTEGGEELVDVVEVQAGCWLVEDEERFRRCFLGKVRCELDALSFAAR